jgi:ribonucleoside-diphosphate reductase beta chain
MSIFTERKNYKPFEYNTITEPFVNAIWKSHWTHNEFNFKSDVQDFKTQLTPEEQEVIKRAVLLISQVEVSIKSYWSNIGKFLPKPEIADVGATFGGNEVIHSRAYSEILTKLGLNEDFQNLLTSGVVNNRVSYLSKYVNKIYKNDYQNITYSLALFSLFTENVSLFSQFFILLGFNRFDNIMKDVANVVAYTSKEETIHALFGTTLINEIRKEEPWIFTEEFEQRIIHEAQEAILAEEALVEWMLQGFENEFLSKDILMAFIKDRINKSLKDIEINYVFDVDQELLAKTTWMDEEILAPAMTDFFHKRPIDYVKKDKAYNENELF